MNAIKLVVSSKKNLEFKYGKKISQVNQLLNQLKAADKKKNLDTRIVFIDDAASTKAAGITPVKAITPKACKDVVDGLYKKYIPAYIVILGAQDIFPFQEIDNPADDDDDIVPSDLPYACDKPYSKKISAFTGPTRVVGRIPDLPGQQKDIDYLKTVIENSIKHKSVSPDKYRSYFSVSAFVWKKSTQLSLQNMFNDVKKLQVSPPAGKTYSKQQLAPLTHFINCHGAPNVTSYYGQKGNSYPDALKSANLSKQVSYGSVVAAECCYGAAVFDSSQFDLPDQSIANNYLGSGAIAFVGSSTIAYGPADSNALADLVTQYFIKNIMAGASSGRALLEARQAFLTDSGPQLDPYELKTLAQFYLLGDPSVQPALREDETKSAITMTSGSIQNNRLNLFNKGISLLKSLMPSQKKKTKPAPADKKKLSQILRATNFEKATKEQVYDLPSKGPKPVGLQKKLTGENARFRTFIKPLKKNNIHLTKVLVVKEDNTQVLGWKVYESR